MNTLNSLIHDLINISENLCDILLDLPCGCDACPYNNTKNNEDEDCIVYKTISQIKDHIK